MYCTAALIALVSSLPIQQDSTNTLAPGEGGPSWPQYHGAGGNRISPESIDLSAWPAAGPDPVWMAQTEKGFSSFVVGEAAAFTLVTAEVDGRTGETCLALDLETGQELWRTALGGGDYDGGGGAGASGNKGGDGPRTTPSLDGDRVYVLDSFLGLSALDRANGKVLWTQDVLGDFDGRQIQWQNAASPLVEGEHVFVAGGGAGQSLLAFDKRTGEVAWKRGDETMTHATPVAATLHGRRMVIFYVRSGLIAVDPKDGQELWRQAFDYRTSSAASPVVVDDIVYVSAGYGVGAAAFRVLAEEDGFSTELLWRKRNKLMNHWSTPVGHDGHLYGMFSFKKYGEGPLQCVELATGEVKWSKDGYGPGNCIKVGELIVALSDAGEVVLVDADPKAYRERARADVLEGKCWSSPAFSDGQLYVRSTREGARLDLSGSER